MGISYIKAFRNFESIYDLLGNCNNHSAFILFYYIAVKVDRNTWCTFIGNHEAIGLTRAKYRKAMEVLTRLNLCTFKTSRGKGTEAKLCINGFFEV